MRVPMEPLHVFLASVLLWVALQWLFRLPPLYLAYRPWIRRRTGAELAHVYQHVRASYRALRLGMIDYGLFWAVRR